MDGLEPKMTGKGWKCVYPKDNEEKQCFIDIKFGGDFVVTGYTIF